MAHTQSLFHDLTSFTMEMIHCLRILRTRKYPIFRTFRKDILAASHADSFLHKTRMY